ncbi:MAG: hypothetical protein IJ587_01175 [Synergistaceae bacterium]|nr:hypothetical protein [Synergistaceae bacterium]
MNEQQAMNAWKKSCVKIGAPTNLLAAVTAFIPVIYLCITYDCWPSFSLVMEAWLLTVIAFGAFYVVEPISYYASLGMSGTYLSFLSGNIGNMRVPCAALALDVTDSQPGTIQAEVVSTMAICGSIVTNLIATTLAAFIGAAIVSVLPVMLKVGLQSYASAAIFGATFGNFSLKQPKLAIFGLGIPLLCKAAQSYIPLQAWLIIVLSVFGTVFIARVFYKREHNEA